MRSLTTFLLAALLLSGCATQGRQQAEPRRAESSAPTSGTPTVSPAAPRSEPAGGGPATPATSSGPLGADDVPRATQLGDDWREYADPGGAEAGFSGNGSFVRARQPAEVVQGLVPLGCLGVEDVGAVPRPAHALEATYRTDDGVPAVALVLAYVDDGAAADAVRQIARQRATCTPPAKGRTEPGRTVIRFERVDDAHVWDRRRTIGEPGSDWLEVVTRVDRRVAVLAMAASQQPRDGLSGLDQTLRASLSRP